MITLLKVLFRQKFVALLLVLVPVVLLLVAGFSFDHSDSLKVRVGVFSPAFNSVSDSFISSLEKGSFVVSKEQNLSLCVDKVRLGVEHACISLSKDFAFGREGRNEVEFYVDYSRANVVWMVLDAVNAQVSERSKEQSLSVVARVLKTVDDARAGVKAQQSSLSSSVSENDVASRGISDAKSSFDAIDASYNASSLNLSVAFNISSSLQSLFVNTTTVADASLAQLQVALASLGGVASASNNSGISESVAATSSQVNSIRFLLVQNRNLSAVDALALNDSLASISAEISLLQKKLDVASLSKDSGNARLGVAKVSLDKSAIALADVQKTLSSLDNSLTGLGVVTSGDIVAPIKTNVKPLVAERRYLSVLFPVLALLVILFSSCLLGALVIVAERTSPAYFRNFLSPRSEFAKLGSSFSVAFVVLLVQVILVFVLAAVAFKVYPSLHSILSVVLVVVLSIVLFTLVGMIFGLFFGRESGALLGSLGFALFSVLASDIVLPIDNVAPIFANIVSWLPFNLSLDVLRKALVLNVSFVGVQFEFFVLLIYVLFFAIVCVLLHFAVRRNHALSVINRVVARVSASAHRTKNSVSIKK